MRVVQVELHAAPVIRRATDDKSRGTLSTLNPPRRASASLRLSTFFSQLCPFRPLHQPLRNAAHVGQGVTGAIAFVLVIPGMRRTHAAPGGPRASGMMIACADDSIRYARSSTFARRNPVARSTTVAATMAKSSTPIAARHRCTTSSNDFRIDPAMPTARTMAASTRWGRRGKRQLALGIRGSRRQLSVGGVGKSPGAF